MAAKDIEAAIRAAQLYGGCDGRVSIKQAQRLYSQMERKIAAVAKRRNMDEGDARRQIVDEASRRGLICPVPGRDI